MNRLTVFHVLFFAVSFSICLSSQAQVRSLKEDRRLQSRFSIEAPCISLQSFCRLLSRKGLVVEAGNECRELKLQLRVQNRPRHEIMARLAELLPGKWTVLPDEAGYQLRQNENAVKTREEWWRVFLKMREDIFRSQDEQMLAEMSKPPIPSADSVSPNISEETKAAYRFDEESKRFFNILPEELKRRIVRQRKSEYDYEKGSIGVSPQNEEGSQRISYSEIPENVKDFFASEGTPLPSNASLTFLYTAGGVFAHAFSVPKGHSIIGTKSLTLPQTVVFRGGANLDSDHIALAESGGENAPDEWKKLAAYQRKTFWNNTFAAILPKEQRHREFTRSRALSRLAQQTTMEYISDYYTTPGKDEETLPGQTNKAVSRTEFDEFAQEYDTSWKERNGIVLFRNNRWYRDDALEVPSALAVKWLKQRREEQRTLDFRVRTEPARQMERTQIFARELSLWQIAHGLKYLSWREAEGKLAPAPENLNPAEMLPPPFHETAMLTLQSYNTIRCFGSLPEEAQNALKEGKLNFADLSASQQQEILRLTPSLAAYQEAYPSFPLILALRWKGTVMPGLGFEPMRFDSR